MDQNDCNNCEVLAALMAEYKWLSEVEKSMRPYRARAERLQAVNAELLEVLESITGTLEESRHADEWLDKLAAGDVLRKARAAIAKAKGEV